jgi:hypothetical protein
MSFGFMIDDPFSFVFYLLIKISGYQKMEKFRLSLHINGMSFPYNLITGILRAFPEGMRPLQR